MRLGDCTLFVVTTGFRLTNSTSGQHVSVGGTQNFPWNKTDYLNIFLPRLYRRGHRFRVTTSLLLNPTVFDARTLPFDGAIICLGFDRVKNSDWVCRHTHSIGPSRHENC